MSQDVQELFQQAIVLPDADRATLAGLLLESLEAAPDADIEAAWSAEIARRVDEVDSGKVATIPWTEVRQKLFNRRNGG